MEAAGAGVAGWVGAGGGVRAGLGAGCFLAAASAGEGALGGRGGGNGEVAAGVVARGGDGVTVPGSDVMILTGGVEAALGKSALVGLPVGTPGTSAAASGTLARGGGAFQTGA